MAIMIRRAISADCSFVALRNSKISMIKVFLYKRHSLNEYRGHGIRVKRFDIEQVQ